MVSTSLELNDDKKQATTQQQSLSSSSSQKISKAKVNLKFINENQIVGSGGGELDDHYTSVSSSSSSTTSINKIINNENNLSNFNRLTNVDDSNKRMAIDLSNDPDLRKYFDSNDVNNEETSNSNKNNDNNNINATVFNLIDISEPTTTTDSNHTTSPSSSQSNIKHEDENPFGMDRFIDQIIIDTKPVSPPAPVYSNATTTPVPPTPTSNLILSPTSVPKKETPSQPPTYKSIIDEFDPIASKLDDLNIGQQQTPAATTTSNASTTTSSLLASKPYMSKPLLPNSYQNLTARPFHSNNNFSSNQTRPNYNIHIPSSTSVQSFSNHHATPIRPSAQQPIISSSQSFTNNVNNSLNKNNFINPFCPTPYHAFNMNNHEQTYRPVQFMNGNLNKMTTPSTNLFMQPTASNPSTQQTQINNNNTASNNNNNKPTADQLLN